MSLRVTLLYGSYRDPRLGIRAVHYITKALEAQGHTVTFVDAKAYNLPILEKRYVDYAPKEAPAPLESLKQLFEKGTDAFVIVAGEYNGFLQPGLKNLLDYFYTEYFYKPCGLIVYSVGPMGGARVSGPLLTTACILGMTPLPSILSIGSIHTVLDEEGNDTGNQLKQKTDKFLKELNWYGNALKEARAKGLPA